MDGITYQEAINIYKILVSYIRIHRIICEILFYCLDFVHMVCAHRKLFSLVFSRSILMHIKITLRL